MRLLLASLVVVAGCQPVTEADIQRPMRAWDHEVGACGRHRVVDGSGDLWTEGGCENGSPRFTRVGHVSAEQQQRIAQAFAALPKIDPEQMAHDCKGNAHFFIERFADDRRVWRVCADKPASLGDPSGLPPLFEAAARAFPQ